MSPLDKQIIKRKVKLIEEDLAKLKKYGDVSIAEYLESYETQLIIERLLLKELPIV